MISRDARITGGLALAVVLGCVPATASAAVTGVENTGAFSPENSTNKSVTVACPDGKRVVGAGGQLDSIDDSSPYGQVVFGAIRPDPTLTSVTAQGREDQSGLRSNWTVAAQVVCAPPPPGLQRVVAASASNSANKSVTASCPTGKRLLGVGADTDGGGGQVAPNDIVPGSGLKSVTVTALEDEDGTTVNWRVRAYAICAAPVAGLQRVVATSATNSSNKFLEQQCPDGTQALSAGAELAGGGGEVVINQLVAGNVFAAEDEDGTSANWTARLFLVCADRATRVVGPPSGSPAFTGCPNGALTGAGGDLTGGSGRVFLNGIEPSGAAIVTAGDDGSSWSGWTVRAYAICAPPLPGRAVVTNPSPQDFVSPKSTSVTCPAGTRVIDAGGVVQGAPREVHVTGAFADAGLTAVTVTAAQDEDFFSSSTWRLDAWAICASAPPGLELVTSTTDPDSDPTGEKAICPGGTNLLGTGWKIDGGVGPLGGEVFLDDVRPNAALTATTVTALEDFTGYPFDWTLTAQAICANP